MPSADAEVEVSAAAFSLMQKWLLDCRAELFNNKTVGHCHVHGQSCSAYPPARFPLVGLTKKPRLDMGEPSHSAKLRCSFAGTTCRGWSMAGSELQFADASERPHAIWAAERQARAEQSEEDVFFQECTPKYPWQVKLQKPMSKSHHVMSVVWGPEMMGWPIRRTRRLCVGLNRLTMVYVGPTNYAEEFMALFACDMKLTGDVFLLASPEQLDAEARRRADLRGVSASDYSCLPLHQLLPPGQLLRLGAHTSFKAEAEGELESETWFADLEQWPKTGSSTPGLSFPTQLTHGSLFAWSRRNLVHPYELLQAHGFNLFQQTSSIFPSPLLPKFSKMSSNQLKILCGNGWHLPAMACWVMFILSNTVRISKLQDIDVDAALHRAVDSDDELF
jgi:hypothetical protein